MKGKITRTTTVQKPLNIKGYKCETHQLKGLWVKVTGEFLSSEYQRLNTQNGFYAVMKRGGTVFCVMTGEHKGLWSKVERD